MDFFTSSKHKRPISLSESTRKFAYDSLHYKYGKDTLKQDAVSLDDIQNFSSLSPLKQYDEAILKIVTCAPLRICENEKISGAATLGAAIKHRVPAKFQNRLLFYGVSHLTTDFETILKIGYDGYQKKVKEAMFQNQDASKNEFYESLLSTLHSFSIFHQRYLNALKDYPLYKNNYQNLLQVPKYPATNFYEAVQSVWFTFAFLRLCGNWPGLGRIDVLLNPYLQKDLQEKKITLKEAKEILAHFFIKGCEWICGGNYGSGDAQHYQNIVLSGIDETGKDCTNDVTYLVLEIIEELGIGDFPITVRINKNTNEKLLLKIAQVIRYGGGIIALYNEDLILNSLTEYGYSYDEAVLFANDGCWEVQIPGKTNFSYVSIDALAIFQKSTLNSYQNVIYSSYEDLYQQFVFDLKNELENIFKIKMELFEKDGKTYKVNNPCSVISLFENDCIERGLSYYEGGCRYHVVSPHIGGLADVANSLYAISKLVFIEKKVTFDQFMKILNKNWEGNEALRKYVLNKYEYYGNDNDEVDFIMKQILDDFALLCKQLDGRCPILFPPGVSTFGRQIQWKEDRLCTASGQKEGTILSGNCSPTPGTDTQGATAIIRSYCKADLKKMVTGAALDVALLPTTIDHENGLEVIVSLMKGFVNLQGYFMQLDIADESLLKEAQLHPENYQTLSVRVSGWNARFITLDKQWQDMIIERMNEK